MRRCRFCGEEYGGWRCLCRKKGSRAALAGGGGAVGHQMLLARLDLFEESVVLTRYREEQPSSTYEVDPAALAEAFSGRLMTTGLLPRECLFVWRANGRVRLGVYVPPQVRALYVHTAALDVTLDVPLPGMVWIGSGHGYRVFAVKQRPSEGSERLFYAPLPNVNYDGRVCQGDVEFPACSSTTIYEALEIFFASAFNRDLSGEKSVAHDCILDQWQALAKREDTEYPLDDLVKSAMKLEDFIAGER